MFGRNYAHHLPILLRSFGEMSEAYAKKVTKKKKDTLREFLQQVYVTIFGIPEVGFQLRSLYFTRVISTYVNEKNVNTIFDAGSGIGAQAFWLAKKYPHATITGGEIDKNKLRFCAQLKNDNKIQNIQFTTVDITKRQKREVYNLVIAIDVLEHVKDYKKVIKNFYGMLKDKGYLYIHVPQPTQVRIFSSLKKWHHDDHVREGISKKELEKTCKLFGFRIISARETYGIFGKLAWEINHLMLSKNFILAGITFPFLYPLILLDERMHNRDGIGIALLAQKK